MKVPPLFELRVWLPGEGEKPDVLRLRGELRELTVDREDFDLRFDLLHPRYVQASSMVTLRGRTKPWKMKRGRPDAGQVEQRD